MAFTTSLAAFVLPASLRSCCPSPSPQNSPKSITLYLIPPSKFTSKARGIAAYAARHNFSRKVSSLSASVELIGSLAALITTLAWLPQIIKILRERRTHDISLGTNAALATGVFLWFVYGLFIGSWPVIGANGVTLLFILAILGLKLRYG